jgi:hypothetical protein
MHSGCRIARMLRLATLRMRRKMNLWLSDMSIGVGIRVFVMHGILTRLRTDHNSAVPRRHRGCRRKTAGPPGWRLRVFRLRP